MVSNHVISTMAGVTLIRQTGLCSCSTQSLCEYIQSYSNWLITHWGPGCNWLFLTTFLFYLYISHLKTIYLALVNITLLDLKTTKT